MKIADKFIGIPFESGGRSFTGADCWGVAVLFYKEYFSIELPSFSGEYYVSDTARLRELVAQHKEGWERVSKPQTGDLILFRVFGNETHVGVYIGNDKFLHSLENQASVVQSLSTPEWSKRIVGYFRYKEESKENLPEALQTQRVYCEVPSGTTIASFIQAAADIAKVDYNTFAEKFTVLVNGGAIPRDKWQEYTLKDSDILEYRVVGTGNVLRLALTVVLAVMAPQIAGFIGLPGVTAAGVVTPGLAGALSVAAVTLVGSLLINAIFPIRPPEVKDPGTAAQQYLFNSGQNRLSKYEAIPVILGRVRVTPPLAANPYVYDKTNLSYIRMLLCWGYGPLKIEDISVGGTSIDQYVVGRATQTYNLPDHSQDQFNTVLSVYGGGRPNDIEQNRPNLKLASSRNDGDPITDANSPWYEYTFAQEIDSLEVTFNFPQGLRKIKVKGDGAGDVYETLFQAAIEYRPAGSTTWNSSINTRTLQRTWEHGFTAPYIPVVHQVDAEQGGYTTMVSLYQWHTVCLDPTGNIQVISGTPTQNPDQQPSVSTLAILDNSRYGNPSTRPAVKPGVPSGYAPLFRICVYPQFTRESEKGLRQGGLSYIRVRYENLRDTVNWSYVGLAETFTNKAYLYITRYLGIDVPTHVSISPGSVSPAGSAIQYVQIGDSVPQVSRLESDLSFSKRKDPFSFTKTISLPSRGRYEVRVRRLNSSWPTPGNDPNSELQLLHDAYLSAITGIKPTLPVIEPKNSQLALTAIDLQATDQVNGSLEGVNALVTTIALDYDSIDDAWVLRPTNNPASLFRYILEHPANAQRIKDELSSRVHLSELEDWHEYCRINGFEYNDVVGSQKSLLDVLRDIASAGRASPLLKDGKWTVVIDRPRDNPVQYFTPHNSWGFESTKVLPQQPDAFRVIFPNEDKGFQEDEVICYNNGKTAENSELYQELRLPGITKSGLAARHARWHLAQLKLRPEVYTLNTDMEYLVCTRGDLVRVAHDVPMWGTGTGRILQRVNDTTLALSEEIYLTPGKQYTIRIRLENGSSITRNLTTITTAQYYSTITITQAVTTTEAPEGALFMLGELEKESQELIVISIEPAGNYTARLTLVDYAPDLYTVEEINNASGIYNDYLFPDFNSNITLPAKNLLASITVQPEIQDIKSDESVLDILSPGVFQVNMVASFKTLEALPDGVKYIEVHVKLDESPDVTNSWRFRRQIELPQTSAKFADLQELETYTVRARYVSSDGRTGPWSSYTSHQVVGKTSKPSDVTGTSTLVLSQDALLQVKWNSNPDPDIAYYEIRNEDTNWGLAGYVWRGNTTQTDLTLNQAGQAKNYYIRAVDYSGNYSNASALFSKTVAQPLAPTNLAYKYSTSEAVTSTTNSTVTITWTQAQKPIDGLDFKEYTITITRPNGLPVETVVVTGTSYTTRADWLGDAQFSIKTRDTGGNESSQALLFITKQAPSAVTNVTAEVVDNNVFLRWQLPNTTSLPVSHVLIKRGTDWNNPEVVIGEKSGTFTSIIELAGGTYNYMVAAVDTDSRESTVVTIPATVSQPPDFIFNAEYTGSFSGPNTTLQNSVVEVNTGKLLMLVDSTETWATHFTSRGWTTPDSQITAGYPVYAQPGLEPASYAEVFDYGTVLANSSVTVGFSGVLVSGAPTVFSTIETSLDGTTWSTVTNGTSVFATNFRYVRVSIKADKNAPGDLYLLESVRVRLDSKQKTDSSNGSALSSDTLGTIVNFTEGKEFIDVVSITVTPGGTTPLIAVYDFKDQTLSGTYSLSSGLCTVTVTNHGLETGQKVRLSFTSGQAINGVYTVTKLSANQYTVSINSIATTSGNVSTYPQSMRVYLFDNNGTRQSGPFGWSIRGY